MDSSSSATPSLWNRLRRHRKVWLIGAACLIALSGFVISEFRKKMGIIEYSSDDPDAQVIAEKDGVEILLEKGSRYTKEIEPGHYDIRLAEPTGDLRLYPPKMFNLDPGGRAIVRVVREHKAVTR
jgi:hypothetical protein